MNITDITTKGGRHRRRKRVGRGEGSGHGKTCGRGHKGAGARSGYRAASLAEGGMFPLFRRIPKVGFNNANFRTVYQIVNVEDLATRFEDGHVVTAAALREAGLIRRADKPVKILGDGELSKKLTVEAHRFSAEAAKKIESVGGVVTRRGPQPKKKFVKRPRWARDPEPAAGKKGSKKGGGASDTNAAKKTKGAKKAKPVRPEATDEKKPPNEDEGKAAK